MISVGNSRFDLGIKDLAILSDATKVGNINKNQEKKTQVAASGISKIPDE